MWKLHRKLNFPNIFRLAAIYTWAPAFKLLIIELTKLKWFCFFWKQESDEGSDKLKNETESEDSEDYGKDIVSNIVLIVCEQKNYICWFSFDG